MASGTANSSTGSASISLPLSTRVYVTCTAYDNNLTPTVEACPRCISGLCNGGQRAGLACTPVEGGLTTLASVFCVPKTGNALIDPLADLRGPGAISIAGDVKPQ